MTNWIIARDRGNQIARELRIRKATEVVHRDQQRRFAKVIIELAQDPSLPARARLAGLLETVPRRRELQTAVALLDLAWRVPPRTQLAQDIILTIRRCYLDAPLESWRARIHDELRERQWHPFPNVRYIVEQVRQIDPVDINEIEELADLERGYPDLRMSILERLLIHGQSEHLSTLLGYLCKTLLLPLGEHESEEARRLLGTLPQRLPRSPAALSTLYDFYLQHYNEPEPRGMLMLALGAYGDALAPLLHDAHQSDPGVRLPIEHLLMQMVARGFPESTRVLFEIVLDAPPSEVGRSRDFLLEGIRRHSMPPRQPAASVLEVIAWYLPILERAPIPELRRLAIELGVILERVEGTQAGPPATEQEIVSQLLERIARDKASLSDRKALRRMARTAQPLLLQSATDRQRPPLERIRLLRAFDRVRHYCTPETAAILFQTFQESPEPSMRVAIVEALAAIGQEPGPQARESLSRLQREGPPLLQKAIERAWGEIFRRPAALADTLPAAKPDPEPRSLRDEERD